MALWHLFPSSRTWRIITHVLTCGVVYALFGLMRSPCIYCLCLAHRLSFSTLATVQSLTTVNQRKNIDPYFKSQLYVEDPGHQKPILISSNGLSKSRERVQDRPKFLPWVEFEPTTSWSTVQRLTDELIPSFPLTYPSFLLGHPSFILTHSSFLLGRSPSYWLSFSSC